MAKTLSYYRDAIRELRNAGRGFTAADGYKLRGDLSKGQKSAITRAYNQLQDARSFTDYDEDDEENGVGYYYEAPSEEDFEYDDIEWLDFDHDYDDFGDEESDNYSEE